MIIAVSSVRLEKIKKEPHTAWHEVGMKWHKKGDSIMESPLHKTDVFNTVLRLPGCADRAARGSAVLRRFPYGSH